MELTEPVHGRCVMNSLGNKGGSTNRQNLPQNNGVVSFIKKAPMSSTHTARSPVKRLLLKAPMMSCIRFCRL